MSKAQEIHSSARKGHTERREIGQDSTAQGTKVKRRRRGPSEVEESRAVTMPGCHRGQRALREGVVKGVAEKSGREEVNQQRLTWVTFEKAISGE